MNRWTYRYTVVVVMVVVAGVCGLAVGPGTRVAGAAGTVSVVGHVGGAVRAVYAAGDYVLWGRGAALEVYTADGASRLGSLLLPALISGIDVEGATAYVAAADGLYAVDLANPAAPALLAHTPAPPLTDLGAVSAVQVVAGYAYVGLQDTGLWVVAAPGAAGAAEAAAPAAVLAPDHHYVSELYHAGSFLFSVDNASVVPGQPRVWDISQPGSPVDLGTVNTVADASGLAVAGGYLFISTFHSGLDIYAWDPADPLNAVPVASLAIGTGAWDLALTPDNQHVLLASDVGLALFNVANPAAPSLVDVEPASLNFATRLAAPAGRALAAAGQAGLQVFDVAAGGVTFAHEVGPRGAPLAAARLNDDVFVAAGTAGLLRLNASNPASPAPTGQVAAGGAAQTVTTVNGWVIAGVQDEVVVFDPATLSETGRAVLPDFNLAWALAAGADTVYVAAGHAGVCAVGVAGGVPALRACLDTPGEALGVALDGTRLYVADSGNGVVVVDVSNPDSPQPLGGYPGVHALAVGLAGPQLLVSDFNGGNGRLLLLNRGEGAALDEAAQYDTRGFVTSIETGGGLIYLANEQGLEVLQAASANSLAEWAWYDSAGSASAVLLVGAHTYLLDGANGLLVLSVTPSDAPPTPEPGIGQIRSHVPLIMR